MRSVFLSIIFFLVSNCHVSNSIRWYKLHISCNRSQWGSTLNGHSSLSLSRTERDATLPLLRQYMSPNRWRWIFLIFFFCSPTYPSIAQVCPSAPASPLSLITWYANAFFFYILPLTGMSQHGVMSFNFYLVVGLSPSIISWSHGRAIPSPRRLYHSRFIKSWSIYYLTCWLCSSFRNKD